MNSARTKHRKKFKSKKEKKLIELIKETHSGNESEHELCFYLHDRVRLMKEVIQILKPRRIKSMAPKCFKNFHTKELNSMLLEELLGISSKRLRGIFAGKHIDDDSSSTDEEEDKPSDVISLDDISDDDFVIGVNSDESNANKTNKQNYKRKNSSGGRKMNVKKEIIDKKKINESKDSNLETSEGHLMSVLELLELQARARAIRSQLALESNKKKMGNDIPLDPNNRDISDDDAIIINTPSDEQILISSSESGIDEIDVIDESLTEGVNQELLVSKSGNEVDVEGHRETTRLTNVTITVENPDKENDIVEINNDEIMNVCDNDVDISGDNYFKTNTSVIAPEISEDVNKLLNRIHKKKKEKYKSNHQKNICTGNAEKSTTSSSENDNSTGEGNVEQQNVIKFKEIKLGTGSETALLYCCDTIPDKEFNKNIGDTDSESITSNLKQTQANELIENMIEESSVKQGTEIDDHKIDEGDGIILNVDQSDLDSVYLD